MAAHPVAAAHSAAPFTGSSAAASHATLHGHSCKTLLQLTCTLHCRPSSRCPRSPRTTTRRPGCWRWPTTAWSPARGRTLRSYTTTPTCARAQLLLHMWSTLLSLVTGSLRCSDTPFFKSACQSMGCLLPAHQQHGIKQQTPAQPVVQLLRGGGRAGCRDDQHVGAFGMHAECCAILACAGGPRP